MKPVICRIFLAAVLLATSLGPAESAEQWVLLSLGKDQKIVAYALGEADGSLTLLSTTATSGKPAAMCASPDGRHLYVAVRPGSIAAYRIGKDAKLSLLGESKVGADAAYLSVHPGGRHLLSAYYAEGKVAIHTLDSDGRLSPVPHQMFETDEKAHAAVFDPSGKFAFVPHTRPNTIFQFSFDAETGKLSPNAPPKLAREANSGPRHLSFHPTNGHAYGSDEQGRSATAYRFDGKSGDLTVAQTISSLAAGGFDGQSSTSDIEVHPSGKFVYIANRGYDFIAGFRVESDGRLSPLPHTATEAVTRSFNIAPDGRHLVAAGQTSGKLAVFRIDGDGLLARVATHEAGENPWWVQIVNPASESAISE